MGFFVAQKYRIVFNIQTIISGIMQFPGISAARTLNYFFIVGKFLFCSPWALVVKPLFVAGFAPVA
jgi:uncharacterized membrane protein YtjA (UPF0391 family)